MNRIVLNLSMETSVFRKHFFFDNIQSLRKERSPKLSYASGVIEVWVRRVVRLIVKSLLRFLLLLLWWLLLYFFGINRWISHKLHQFRIDMIPYIFQILFPTIFVISFELTAIFNNRIDIAGPNLAMCRFSLFGRFDDILEGPIISHATPGTFTNNFGKLFGMKDQVFEAND